MAKSLLSIGFRNAKRAFFDKSRVMVSVDAAKREVLSHFGAYVRKGARWSIKEADGSAPPGQPPHSHTGLIKRAILYYFDRVRESVVVGPVLLDKPTSYGPMKVPQVLEHGGTVRRTVDGEQRIYKYEARPFMGPAFVKGLDKRMPAMWRDSVRA